MGERVRPGNVRRFGTVWNSRVPPVRGCVPIQRRPRLASPGPLRTSIRDGDNQKHRKDCSPANAVHSRTSYWNATPSGSFCRRNNPGGGAAGRIVAGPAAGPLTCPDRAARRQDRDRQSSEFYRAAPLKHGLSKRGPGG
jgi:hypothetical protein